MTFSLNPDTSSMFMRFNLSAEDEQLASSVSPLFLAYLQNKIEAYATAVVNASLPYDSNPENQVKAILAHERLKNFVEAYQELLAELIQSVTSKEN